MKKVLIITAIGLISLILVITLKSCSGNGAIKVTTEKADKRSIIETVSANGKIQPEVAVKISSDVSGEIVELLVKEGAHVNKGDLLLKINPDIYISMVDRTAASLNTSKAQYANAKSQLEQVKAQFANTESSYNRNKKLFEQGAISQSEYDAARAAYEAAKANVTGTEESVHASEFNVKSAEASLKESRDNLNKTTIFAPVSGTVSKLNVEKGERVVGTSQMTGTELLTIANLNEMEVSVDVNENDIVRVHLNDTSIIEVDAYLGRQFKGIVTEIANSANTLGVTAEQVTNFPVKIRILQESYKDLMANAQSSPFRPGMSASVDIQTKTVSGVISVPIQAVTTRTDSSGIKGKKQDEEEESEGDLVVKDEKEESKKDKMPEAKAEECVFILVDGKAKKVKVKTGIQDNNYIEILSGIKAGDEVISGPYGMVSKILKDGTKVEKVSKSELFTVKPGS
jgi:HlyD family secretion protein